MASRRLVWLAEVPWQGLPQRHHHLVRRLQRDWQILFVEPAPSGRLPRAGIARLDGIAVAQVVPITNAKSRAIRAILKPRLMRQLARRIAVAQVGAHVKRIGWRLTDTDRTVVCSNVYLAGVLDRLRPARVVADISDDPRHFPDEPAWVTACLADLVRSADVITTSSTVLFDEIGAFGAARVEYLPNGVRADLLAVKPASSTGGPVGYLGYLGPWVDFDLLDLLVDRMPATSFELVGPIAPSEKPRVDSLARRPNVRYLGIVAEDAIAATLGRFSVGLIPFRLTQLTRAVNPLKLYEYAAFDMPIVSTPFSPEIRVHDGTIDVCETPDAFVRAVRMRVTGCRGPSTRRIAEGHSWEAIAERFARIVGDLPAGPVTVRRPGDMPLK
jgi:glycosyltransferase involved in cell wall biosynthesis